MNKIIIIQLASVGDMLTDDMNNTTLYIDVSSYFNVAFLHVGFLAKIALLYKPNIHNT